MRRTLAALSVLAVACSLAALLPGRAVASGHQPGDRIDDASLATIEGGRAKLLGGAGTNVLVFFRPDQKYSQLALGYLARCQKELSGKPVRWVGVVSDRYAAADVSRAVSAAGLELPVLIDEGNALYGRFGLKMHPVVVVVDAKHRVVAFQPFRKVNFYDQVMARVRYQLGEITEAELNEVLSPATPSFTGARAEAMRRVKLGRVLLAKRKLAKAHEAATVAIEKAPELAAGYTLRGQIYLAQEQCKQAVASFRKALDLDGDDADAAAGIDACSRAGD